MSDSRKRAVRDSSADNSIGNIELQSLLYDFYGSLLSSSQNEVMALYHEDNLSLSEIAEELGMTRQAVHYTLKKAEKALAEYEDKLGLLAGYHRSQELADRARAIIDSLLEDHCNSIGSEASASCREVADRSSADAVAEERDKAASYRRTPDAMLKELQRIVDQLAE